MKKSTKLSILSFIIYLFSVTAHAVNVPNTFTANTPASASEVNANFTALKNGINGVINSLDSTLFSYNQRVVTDASGVGLSTCSTGERLVSASCNCTGTPSSNNTNFGVLFVCEAIDNSALGGCYVTNLYDPLLPSSPVRVTAVCADITVGTALPSAAKKLPSAPTQEAIDTADKLKTRLLMMREAMTNK